MRRRLAASWIKGSDGSQLDLVATLLGVVRSLLVSIIGAVILLIGLVASQAEVLYFSDFINLTFVASVLLGGLKAGGITGKNGWLHGLIVAVVYSVILVLVGFAFLPSGYNIVGLMLQIIALGVIGALGGILGVNLCDYRERQLAKRTRLLEKYKNIRY